MATEKGKILPAALRMNLRDYKGLSLELQISKTRQDAKNVTGHDKQVRRLAEEWLKDGRKRLFRD